MYTCGKLCLSFVCMLKYSNLQTVACHCDLSKLNWHFYYNFNYYCVHLLKFNRDWHYIEVQERYSASCNTIF